MDNNTNSKDYKYILIDYSDTSLMWNCAVSILFFLILLFYIFMNWRPKCSNTTKFEDMTRTFDLGSIAPSLGGSEDRYI
jgi:hypothetical protein